MDPKPILDEAAKGGWEAAMVAFILLSSLGFLVWLVRRWMDDVGKREDRMSKRIDALEDVVIHRLESLAVQCREALDRNAVAVTNLTTALNKRPCMNEGTRQ
jgi:hypothetical protein